MFGFIWFAISQLMQDEKLAKERKYRFQEEEQDDDDEEEEEYEEVPEEEKEVWQQKDIRDIIENYIREMERNDLFDETEEDEDKKDKNIDKQVWQQRCQKCQFHVITCHFIKLE